MKRLFLLVLLAAAASACDKKLTAPSDFDRLPSGSPSHTVVEVTHLQSDRLQVRVWGLPQTALKEQPQPGFTVDGGNLVLYNYACGTRKKASAPMNNSKPRENSNSVVIPEFQACGGNIDIQVGIEVVKFENGNIVDGYFIPYLHTNERMELLFRDILSIKMEGDHFKGKILNFQ